MGRPPILSDQQRHAALEKAKQSRSRRAEIKTQVKSGLLSVEDVLALSIEDEAVSKCV